MKHVAVTGASGFVGGHLAAKMLQLGLKVNILVRPASAARVESLIANGAQPVWGDMQDADALNRLCDGCDTVFHVAAYMAKDSRESSHLVNVVGTESLLRACTKAGVSRLVNLSSISVYRATTVAGDRISETTEPLLSPKLNFYSYTKLCAERAVADYCSNPIHRLKFINLRPTNVYGAGCGPWDQNIARHLRARRACFGAVTLDFVHIDDLVEACLAAGMQTQICNRHFNIGHENYHLDEFFRDYAVAHRLGYLLVPRVISRAIGAVIDWYGAVRGHLFSVAFSRSIEYPYTQAAEALGYAPKTALREYFSSLTE